MEVFLIICGAVSCVLSSVLYALVRKGPGAVVIAELAPLPLLFAYIFATKDEFGYWAVALSLGVICCLMGSAVGILLVMRLKNQRS